MRQQKRMCTLLRRILAVFLTVTMMMGLLLVPGTVTEVKAANVEGKWSDHAADSFAGGSGTQSDPVTYMDWNGSLLVEKTGDDACADYTVVESSTGTTKYSWGEENEAEAWYVVKDNVTINYEGTEQAITVKM